MKTITLPETHHEIKAELHAQHNIIRAATDRIKLVRDHCPHEVTNDEWAKGAGADTYCLACGTVTISRDNPNGK